MSELYPGSLLNTITGIGGAARIDNRRRLAAQTGNDVRQRRLPRTPFKRPIEILEANAARLRLEKEAYHDDGKSAPAEEEVWS